MAARFLLIAISLALLTLLMHKLGVDAVFESVDWKSLAPALTVIGALAAMAMHLLKRHEESLSQDAVPLDSLSSVSLVVEARRKSIWACIVLFGITSISVACAAIKSKFEIEIQSWVVSGAAASFVASLSTSVFLYFWHRDANNFSVSIQRLRREQKEREELRKQIDPKYQVKVPAIKRTKATPVPH